MLVEVLVALAILGLISVAFLQGLGMASRSVTYSDVRETAKSLAESQMDYAIDQLYAESYDPDIIPSEYPGYSADINVSDIPSRDTSIQNIEVVIQYQGKQVYSLESYKTL